MNWEMMKGLAERGAYVLVMWLVSARVLPESMAGEAVVVIMAVLAFGWGWWVNRSVNLIKTTAALPDVSKIVVTRAASGLVESSKPDARISSS